MGCQRERCSSFVKQRYRDLLPPSFLCICVYACVSSTIGPPWKGSGFRALWRNDGATYVDTKRTSTNLGSFNIKDVIGMAYDDSTRKVRFYKNGKYVGSLTTLGRGQQYFGASSDSSGKGAKYRFNFGASKFKYKPPAGYEGLKCGVRGVEGVRGVRYDSYVSQQSAVVEE